MGVIKVFKLAAEANGGRFRKLSQGNFTKHYSEGDDNKKGVCRALCMAHSGLRAMGTNIGSAIRGDDMYEIALAQFAGKLQSDVTNQDAGTDLRSSFQNLYKRQAPLVGLSLCGPVEQFSWQCHRQLAQLAEATKFRVQVNIPNHVIALQTVGDKLEIYDPNAGSLMVDIGKG